MKSIRQPKRRSIIPSLYWVCAGVPQIMAVPDANAAVVSFQEGRSPDAAYTIGATYLHSNKATEAQDADPDDELLVGFFNGSTAAFRTLLEFDLTAIETAAGTNPVEIDSVQLVLNTEGDGAGDDIEITASTYGFDFDETTATWNVPAPGDTAAGGTIGTPLSVASFDPTSGSGTDVTLADSAALRTAVASALAGDNILRVVLHQTGGTPDGDDLFARLFDEDNGANGPELIVDSSAPEPQPLPEPQPRGTFDIVRTAVSGDGTELSFYWTSAAGQLFDVACSEDLVNWTVLDENLPAGPGSETGHTVDLDPQKTAEFFRVQYDQPNIIVIMADDMGYSDLSCYGGEIQTPHIDSIATNGVRFTGFKNAGRCTPSRASLLTGRYSHSVGVGAMSKDQNYPGYRGQLSQDAPTMAEILKPHGYATGIVGKWHQTYTGSSGQEQLFPLDRGFDFFYGTWRGAKDYFSPQYMMRDSEHISGVVYPEDYYLTDDLSAEAIDFVEAQIALEKPFYLYLAHYAPHKPFQAPADRVQELVDRYRAGYETLQNDRFARMQTLGVLPANAVVAAGMPAWDNLSSSGKEAWATEMATYAAMIEIMDDGIGQLIQVLKDNNQYDNTLILVLSDNGSTDADRSSTTLPRLSNTPFRSYKAHTLEGGISSPLIISWPEKLSALDGSVRHGPCHIIDILPTCLDAADLAFSSSFRGSTPVPPDGISLMPAVKGTPLPERPLFWEHLGRRAVYQEGWKLVTDSVSDPWKLYDLAADPTEQEALTVVYPDHVNTLESLWDNWATTNNVVPGPNTWP